MEVPLDSRNGSAARTLVTLTATVGYMDAAADGSVYADQWDRPWDILRFSAKGGAPERLAEVTKGTGSPLALPDKRVLFASAIAGREILLVAAAGKDPVPFVETEEQTGGPIAMLGSQYVIFRIGKGDDHKAWSIGVASASDGRIVRRLDSARGHPRIYGGAGSPDGKTLYFISDGTLWAAPVDGGEPRKLASADAVAPNPNGQDLVVMRLEKDGPHLARLPLPAGAPEQALPYSSPLLLNGSFSPIAVRADGRIAITILRPESWWDEPAILDPKTGQVEKLAVTYDGDVFNAGWTPDGALISAGQPMRGSLWRFRKTAKQ
jgi:hypothetical protein